MLRIGELGDVPCEVLCAGAGAMAAAAEVPVGSSAPPEAAAAKRAPRLLLQDYAGCIRKVLSQVHPDTGITEAAVAGVHARLSGTFEKLLRALLADAPADAPVTGAEVQAAVNLVIDGELAKHAVSEGTKAVAKLGRSGSFDSRSQRAGLVFVIEPVAALLQGRAPGRAFDESALAFLAAVLEYLSAELLELSGNATRDASSDEIIPHHLELAIRGDEASTISRDSPTPAPSPPLLAPCLHSSASRRRAGAQRSVAEGRRR